jgi:beta-lactamase class A
MTERRNLEVKNNNLWRKFRSYKWLFWPLIIIVPLIILDVAAQLLWPANRFLPFQKIDHVEVGLMSKQDATDKLLKLYKEKRINIISRSGEKVAEVTLKDIGLKPDVSAQINGASYKLWQRLTPFVGAPQRMFSDENSEPKLVENGESAQLTTVAADAQIVIKDGKLSVVPAVNGCQIDIALVQERLKKMGFSYNATPTIILDIDVEHPDISTATAQELFDKVSAHLSDIKFKIKGENYQIDAKTVATWLTFTKNEDTKQLEMHLSREQIEKYFQENQLASKVTVAAKNTTISLLNGKETERVNGADGVAVDYDATLTAISARLLNGGEESLELKTVVVKPQVIYNRSYTGDYNGLRLELSDKFAGKSTAIVLVDLSGRGRELAINANKVFTAASTYKLFTAYSMLKAIESGESTWNDPLNGTTLATCFDKMIINSDNACPKAWATAKTYQRLTAEAHSVGASSTCLGCSNGMSTTARDLATFLTKIYNGSILSPLSNARLLDVMKRQVYRQGIPAGIGGNGTVADKVGFLDGLLHDAAIVYSNKGDYILVIMTDGSSWKNIAEIARLIQAKF